MRIDNKSEEILILTKLPLALQETLNQWKYKYNMVVEHIQTGYDGGDLTFMVKRTPKVICSTESINPYQEEGE